MESKCLSCEWFWKTQDDKGKRCYRGGSDGGLIHYCTGYKKLYKDSNAVQIKMKLNRKTDADILSKLDAVGNKQGYIKLLIRADMERAD